MIRGFMKTTSQTALALAAAGLLMSTYAPAKAADLGGGCCADLEERVAELEATTARKGNRVVSLQVYGQVNKALLVWDDGVESDAYVVDNVLSSSRFGFLGKATIKPGWTAGYNMEFELQDARSDQVTQGKTGDEGVQTTTTSPSTGTSQDVVALTLRQNYFWIESDRLGRISLGHQSTAGDGAYEVNLSNSMRTADVLIGNNFYVRVKGTTSTSGSSKLSSMSSTPGQVWASDLDATRNDVVRYDTPSILGFILSASWGDNDYADVALRFKKEFDQIRVAAAIAYQWDNQFGLSSSINNDYETFGGSISVMHVPTGLYMAFQVAGREYKDGTSAANSRADSAFWYLQGGIERKFLPYGATTVYGEYGRYDDFRAFKAASGTNPTGSEATRWGFGVNQTFDSAALDVFAHATFWDFSDNSGYSYEELGTFLVGSRIKF